MRFLHGLALAVAVSALSACGDADSLGGDVNALGSVGASGSGGTAGALGSAGTVGSGSGGAVGADGGLPDEVTLTFGPFLVEPSGEAFVCQTFANPFGGSDVYIREFESHITQGLHHFMMNAVVEPPSGLGPCSGIEPPAGPFATQSPDDIFTYPEGVAARLFGRSTLKLISHHLNTSATNLLAEARVTLRRARPEAVRQVARVQSMSYDQINVPPHQTQTVESGVTLAAGLEWDLLWILPHMHLRGTHFSVTAGRGTMNTIFETDGWQPLSHRFDPPYRLNSGDSLNYSCTFFNETAAPLVFGGSAISNEMCALVVHYTSGVNSQ